MTPRQYGEQCAAECGPLTAAQIEAAARLFVGLDDSEQVAA